MNYRFVSSGQSVDDAQTVAQTLLANSLKPLAPVNLRGERNLNNDLLMLWTARSRIAPGMIPGSDLPTGEERSEFSVEIYDGSTLKRTMNRILVGSPMPALLTAIAKDKFTFISGNGNSVVVTDGTGHSFIALQTIKQGHNFIEATLVASSGGDMYFGLLASSKDWNNIVYTDLDYYALLRGTGNLSFNQANTSSLYSASVTASDGHRIRIAIEDDSVKFYRNYSGEGSQPLAVASASVLSFPYQVYIRAGSGAPGTRQCNDVMMTIDPQPAAIYTADQQTVDFGSVQSSVKVRIYQVSQVVGRGPYAEANL